MQGLALLKAASEEVIDVFELDTVSKELTWSFEALAEIELDQLVCLLSQTSALVKVGGEPSSGGTFEKLAQMMSVFWAAADAVVVRRGKHSAPLD